MIRLMIRLVLGLILVLGSVPCRAEALPSLARIEQAIRQRDIPTGEVLLRIERIKLNFPGLPAVTRRHILAAEAEALIEAANYDGARIALAERRDWPSPRPPR